MAALTILGGFFLWGRYDASITKQYLDKYRPIAVPEKPTLTSQDVTVVCTLDPPPRFLECLRSWLANNPREIVISTTQAHYEEVFKLIEDTEVLTQDEKDIIAIVVSETNGFRPQLIEGVGVKPWGTKIIAKTDDHITWGPAFLENMLAALDPASPDYDPSVTAVLPLLVPHIPEERRNAASANPWEVAGLRGMWNKNPQMKSLWAGQRWCTCLVGVAFLIRGEVLRDPAFQEGFLNETWRGGHVDPGDDCFITRWVQSHDQLIAVQATPATTVQRTVKMGRALVPQLLRWERSLTISFLKTLTQVPQIWRTTRGKPTSTTNDKKTDNKKDDDYGFYIARIVLQRGFRALLTAVHVCAWAGAFYSTPGAALALLGVYVYLAIPGYVAFFAQYPWITRYWWAAVLFDFVHVVQDPIAWATLSDTTWKRGEVV